ncbi:MAG TPA: hypothetical protein VLV50_11780 [Stellaceae bacterium]|nr:hypothetical protein [Stellaceae bacterium]
MVREKSQGFAAMRRLIYAVIAAAPIVMAVSAPALAHNDDWHGHNWRAYEWREHEWREHERWEHHAYAYPYSYYGYGYAPGYGYAAPPPAYYPPAALNFGFTFR